MKDVRLVCIHPCKGEKWYLVPTRKGFELRDADDELVLKIRNSEAGMRIKFPSFWASVANLVIVGRDEDELYTFEPKPKTLEAVRELVNGALDRSPKAAAALMRKRAMRDLLIGGGSLLLGIAITVINFHNPDQQGKFYVMTGLIGVGAVEIIRGIWLSVKASERG